MSVRSAGRKTHRDKHSKKERYSLERSRKTQGLHTLTSIEMSLDLEDDDNAIQRVTTSFKAAPPLSHEELDSYKQSIQREHNARMLEKIFQSNSTLPVKVPAVQIEGTENYTDSFLSSQISPFIKDSTTFGKLLENVDVVTSNFYKTQAAENVRILLESQPVYNSNDLVVIPKIKLFPAKKFMAKTGTNIGNGEGDGYLMLQWRNIFGGAENLMLDATTGTRTSSSYILNYSEPFRDLADWRTEISLFLTNRKIDWSSHHQSIKGINTKLMSLKNGVNHEFSVENILRSINKVSFGASSNIMFHAGDDIKSSFIYKFTHDTRDDKILPKSGNYFSLSNEFSGLFPKINTFRFFKQSLEGCIATNINDGGTIFNLSLRGGWLYTLSQTTHLMDRFYLGGPNDVRGFFFNGLGPRNYNDTLGGDIFLSGGISVFNRLPYLDKDSNLKLHSFINFGKLSPLDRNDSIKVVLKDLLTQHSIGAGFGLVYRHPMARFELNFVLPITAHRSDSIRKGLQYGIGLSFM